MFEVNEIAEMTLQGQKSKSLKKKNMTLSHHLPCRFAAGKKRIKEKRANTKHE